MSRLTFQFAMAFLLLVALSLCACKPPAESGAGHEETDGHAHAETSDGHAHEGEGAHADEVVLTPHAIEQYGVKVEEAQRWRLRPTFIAPARVAFNAEAMAHVGAPVSGRIVELRVRAGDSVKVGDPLLVVESPELGAAQSDFLIKRSAAETAAPGVDLSRAAWDRARTLHDAPEGVAMSVTEVQKREAEHRAAIGALRAAQAEAQAAENRLHLLRMTQDQIEALARSGEVHSRLTIVAPLAGRIVQREVTLGERVHPEREALLIIADMTTLWVLASVPEARLQEVGVGSTARIRIGGVEGASFEGAVTYIAPMVDASTRSAQVRIEVTGDMVALKPGMFAQAEIVAADPDGEEPAPVVAVPESAVQIVEGAPALFVPAPSEDHTYAKRSVVVGKAVGGLVPIHSGLVEGEPFVAAGSFILKAELGKGSAQHSH